MHKNIINATDKIIFTTLSFTFLFIKYLFIFGANSIISLVIIIIYGLYLISTDLEQKSTNAIK
tara:strand:+ start:747 stop:935 length:189 start_codon:yes stop_codon:yes gene_type:complete